MTCYMVVDGFVDWKVDEVIQEARVFFSSFRKHCLQEPIFIIGTRPMYFKKVYELKNEYKNIQFSIIDESRYEAAGKQDPRYYKLEAFNIDDDKVFVFDTDLIFLDSIDDIFKFDAPIAMAREKNRDCFNSGMVQINRRKCGDVYERLLAHPHDGGFGNDQNILNSFFRGKIAEIPMMYNRIVLELEGVVGVVGIHLVLKPWLKEHAGRCSESVTEKCRAAWLENGGKIDN